MDDIHAALLHHLGKITVADRSFAIPAHAKQDDPNQEPAAFEYGHRQMAL
jgi:hypothetical protein